MWYKQHRPYSDFRVKIDMQTHTLEWKNKKVRLVPSLLIKSNPLPSKKGKSAFLTISGYQCITTYKSENQMLGIMVTEQNEARTENKIPELIQNLLWHFSTLAPPELPN